MELLPTKDSLKNLYFGGFFKECATLATHGITQLICMHSGRGGALNFGKLAGNALTVISNYFNMLYWAYRAYNNLAKCNFISHHLQNTKLYDKYAFEKIHSTHISLIYTLKTKTYKVHISCMWTDTHTLYKDWAHLFESVTNEDSSLGYAHNDGTNFVLTENKNEADYFVIVWGSRDHYTDDQLSRTIFFRTEPIFPDKFFGTENKSEPFKFLKFFDYYDTRYPNCIENWLKKSSDELLNKIIVKDENLKWCISSVVSNKYVDVGHKYRIDLLRYMIQNIHELQDKINNSTVLPECSHRVDKTDLIHIYGFDNTLGFPPEYYHGALPERDKSVLMKYKYTLIAENNSIPGYMTEKIADGILSECLVFYWGCPNIQDYFPPVDGDLPYVILPMHNVADSYNIIKTAVAEDWWSKKINAIIATKKLILTKFMMKHRIAQVIREDVDRKILGDDAINLLRLVTSKNNGEHAFKKVLYTGARYDELNELVSRRTENQVKFEYFHGLSENLPDGKTFLVQEFSNKPSPDACKADTDFIRSNNTGYPIQHYTVGFTRFSTRNYLFADSLPKAYVINLSRRLDRFHKFNTRFPRVTGSSWTFERFAAVDGNSLKINGEFPRKLQYLFRNNDFCSKPGVIGCAMSHIKLWQSLAADANNASYIIYEDDVEFADNYAWKLYSSLQQITFDWDMLFLGHLMCYELQNSHRMENDELPTWERMDKYIVPNRTSWIGTASYIISKRGAQKLLDYIEKNGVQHGIDYLIQLQFPNLLRAYGVNPMLNFAEYESPLNPNINVDSDIQK